MLNACCTDETRDDETKSNSGNVELTDTSADGILSFIRSGIFESWETKQECLISNGVSAHRENSQTYINDIAFIALKGGRKSLPSGSILVKTLLGADGGTVDGHALMVKATDGPGNENWIWYEGFTASEYKNPYYGASLAICAGCHGSGGINYVRIDRDTLGI